MLGALSSSIGPSAETHTMPSFPAWVKGVFLEVLESRNTGHAFYCIVA
jgi:hypothetical protein